MSRNLCSPHRTTCSAGDLKGSKIRASVVSCKYLFRHLTPIPKPSLRSANYTRAIAFSSLLFSLPFATRRSRASLFSFGSRERVIFLHFFDETTRLTLFQAAFLFCSFPFGNKRPNDRYLTYLAASKCHAY